MAVDGHIHSEELSCFADGELPREWQARRASAAELFHDPGNATARAVHEVYSVIELDEPAHVPRRDSQLLRCESPEPLSTVAE